MWRRMVRGLALGSVVSLLFLPEAFAQQFNGTIEVPAEGATVSGMVLVRGFALAEAEISKIELYVDDAFQYQVNRDIPRVDVIEAHPTWEGVHQKKPGFQTGFLAGRFTNGPHTIHALVHMSSGETHVIGRRVVEVDNTINQPPFGQIDIPNGIGVADANGSFPVVGWTLDTDGIETVNLLVDGLVMQSAVYGDPRPDVGHAFQDLPAAEFSGFIAHLNSTRLLDGIHQISIRVTDRLGLSRTIGERTVQVFNSEHNLRPFGYLDEPLRDQQLYGTNCGVLPPCQLSPCIPIDFDNHITPVRGWALDLGTRENLGRVAYAELMIDGAVRLTTDDCTFSSELGAFVNCYGLERQDVSRYFPNYPDAPRAGFLFTLDVGALIASTGIRQGNHVLKVRVGDQEQTFADIPHTAGIPVFFTCVEQTFDFPAVGYIDYPVKQELLGGTVTFHGWAADQNNGIRMVEIFIDGNFMGPASYGHARPDVVAAYPTLPQVSQSGWRYTINTNQLSDGVHRLTVRTIDNAGNEAILGSVDFYVDNLN